MEKSHEPGSAKYGNFINYYSFNPPERRIKLLPAELLGRRITSNGDKDGPILALDVGCNTGALTMALFEHIKSGGSATQTSTETSGLPSGSPVKILGVDLDPTLILRAKEANSAYQDTITFETADIMEASDREEIIRQYLKDNNNNKFNVTFLFSVTMWIHLNHGDEGLKDFLKFVSSISSHLVVEPQPWKCYASAMRRMKKLVCQPFKYFDELSWRQDVDSKIVEFLETECSMTCVNSLGKTDWSRQVLIFSHVGL